MPIHVIDFEGSRQSGIVEYGVVTLAGTEIVATYTRLCAAIGTISDRDRQQHGISEQAAAEQARFDTEWDFFAQLRATGRSVRTMRRLKMACCVAFGRIRAARPISRQWVDRSLVGGHGWIACICTVVFTRNLKAINSAI